MSRTLASHEEIVGRDVLEHLRQLARPLEGLRVVHVNSTRLGGGVAEILAKLVPFMVELGIDATWEVIDGDADFFASTKGFHNALQGIAVRITEAQLRHYEEVNQSNWLRLQPALEEADFVFIHDPQPAALVSLATGRRGKWVWRCHIDLSHPYRPVWKYLQALRGPVRRQHLLHPRLRPAPAKPCVHHPAQHRRTEREEHGSAR